MFPIYTYKTVIIEDELINITILRQLLSTYQNIRVVGTANTVEKAEKLILKTKPDLLFLDIALGNKNGLELYQQLKAEIDWSMQVIIYSSHTEYALNACCLSVFYFLTKPNVFNDFKSLMESFFKVRRIEEEQHKQSIEKKADDAVIMISTNAGMLSIHLNDIGYFYYIKKRKLWCMLMTCKKEYLLKYQTKAETILAISPFFKKVNPNRIINIHFFSAIIDNQCLLRYPFDEEPSIKFSRFALKSFQCGFTQL